jgi:uncharacterized membrane protein YphA (DoxX/SURF4 family)
MPSSSKSSRRHPNAGEAASWAGLAVRASAAAIWIVAGAAKIPQLGEFADIVQRYRILPEVLARPFAFALPFFEIGIGLYLLLGLFVRGTAIAGTVLFAAFLAVQIRTMALGISLDCGCFGAIAGTRVGPLTILRDLCLGIPTYLMLALPARRLSLDRMLFDAPDTFSVVMRRIFHGLESAVG